MSAVEILVHESHSGSYGFAAEQKLIRRKGKTYLIRDSWCGNNLEGFCYRPFVYSVPDDKANEVKRYLENWDDCDEQGIGSAEFLHLMISDGELPCIGRASSRARWALDI